MHMVWIGDISASSCSLLICVCMCSRLGVRIRKSVYRLPVSFGGWPAAVAAWRWTGLARAMQHTVRRSAALCLRPMPWTERTPARVCVCVCSAWSPGQVGELWNVNTWHRSKKAELKAFQLLSESFYQTCTDYLLAWLSAFPSCFWSKVCWLLKSKSGVL